MSFTFEKYNKCISLENNDTISNIKDYSELLLLEEYEHLNNKCA